MKLFVALSVCLNNKEMFNPYYETMIPWAPGWLMIQPWRPSQLAHVDANEKNTWEVAVTRMTIEDENASVGISDQFSMFVSPRPLDALETMIQAVHFPSHKGGWSPWRSSQEKQQECAVYAEDGPRLCGWSTQC